jgi:hypothetical protein
VFVKLFLQVVYNNGSIWTKYSYYFPLVLVYAHSMETIPLCDTATEGRRKGLRTGYPRTVDEEKWLRGAWPTNERGVAQFSSKFVWTSF